MEESVGRERRLRRRERNDCEMREWSTKRGARPVAHQEWRVGEQQSQQR